MGRQKSDEPEKVQLPVRFLAVDAERFRNFAWATGRSYQKLIEQAALKALQKEEAANGGPFPQRPSGDD